MSDTRAKRKRIAILGTVGPVAGFAAGILTVQQINVNAADRGSPTLPLGIATAMIFAVWIGIALAWEFVVMRVMLKMAPLSRQDGD